MASIKISLPHVPSILFTIVAIFKMAQGQDVPGPPPEAAPCGYSSGSLAAAVILTFFCTVLVIAFFLYLWKRRQDSKKDTHLILETDPERGVKAEYAFDNPGFKDTSIVATSEKISKPETSIKTKWGNWSPLSALNLKPDKKRALDDLALENKEVKVVALKSQDFTGLGFNICGNMKEGIFIKDILHRGPAFESGKLNPGDRINSVTISFEHMVYEDALTILSYASPYEVMIEAKSGRVVSYTQGQGQNPIHPIYRSSSLMNLFHTEKSAKKKLFGDDYSSSSNYSSLQKSRSNVTTLERKESKSPRPNQSKPKKVDKSPHKLTPEMSKTHLEQKMSKEDLTIRDDLQKTEFPQQTIENKGHKFGIRVLPMGNQQKSPKIVEQNQNNMNIEKYMEEIPIQSIDEVDVTKLQPPQARKREKKSPEPAFQRNDSGIRRDKDGIPLEIPDHMWDTAVVARKNRKSSTETGLTNGEDASRKKGKAPSPPSEVKLNFNLGVGKTKAFEDLSSLGRNDSLPVDNKVRYGSDSEEEIDNTMSSVNTIELNSSDITIHQTEEEERKARKTASTGDLSKMKNTPRSNTGTLERAQSLDITDTSGPSLVKMRTYDATENLLIDREPRLSLILDGLTTFQKNRLKKSTEWGNLEDAILNFSREVEDYDERRKSEPQFNAVMDRVIQIKRESEDPEVLSDDVVRQYQVNAVEEPKAPKVVNRIWPGEDEMDEPKFENSGWKRLDPKEEVPKRNVKTDDDLPPYMKRQQVPVVPERTKIKVNEVVEESKSSKDIVTVSSVEHLENESGEKIPLPTERVSKVDLVLNASPKKAERIEQISTSPKSNSVMNLSNHPNSPISVEFECIKPIPPKRERTPEKETVIDLAKNIHLQPMTSFEKQGIIKTCSQIAKDRYTEGEMIKDEWEIDTLNNTSPPPSMTLVDEVMDSYNKNYGNTVTVVQTDEVSATPGPSSMASNIPDETKTIGSLKNATANFIFNEQSIYETDTNIPDDVKVSRSSYESLETRKTESEPKSDDAKTEDLLVTHVTVTENGGSNLHSLELSINNEPSELYTTALDNTILSGDVTSDVTVIMSKPEKVILRTIETVINEPLVEITESSFSKVTKGPEEMSVSIGHLESPKDDFKVEIMESKYSTFEVESPPPPRLKEEETIPHLSIEKAPVDDVTSIEEINSLTEMKQLEDSDSAKPDKKTYVTEIQVITPNSTISNVSNVSAVTVTPQSNDDHLESAFENYVKNFESKLEAFESNMQNFENNLEDFIKDEPKSIVLEEKDVEMQVSKIQEIAEEQLKTLPEMRFTTSSYETGRKTPEKRHSFELLRSNFEKASNDKSPPRRDSNTPPKSRIPIATTMKTPPMSPERRDSRNLENEDDKAILELMSSSTIHSTPFTSKIKPPSVGTKNVSVTSIKNNSKIPSGLPTLSTRPPIPPRKNDDNVVQVSSTNGGIESSFKQWVFNPNSNVSNVTVGKDK